jgi:hypothetical protein
MSAALHAVGIDTMEAFDTARAALRSRCRVRASTAGVAIQLDCDHILPLVQTDGGLGEIFLMAFILAGFS